MADWKTDAGAYRRAYENAVSNPPATFRISAPEFISTCADYEASNCRVLVLGQETAGNDRPILAARKTLALATESYRDFDFSIGKEQTSSPFWCAYREVCGFFGLSNRGAAWANIAACQRRDESRATALISLPKDEQEMIAGWQSELVREMFRFIRPKLVIAFTGYRYDWLLSQMIPDLDMREVQDRTSRQMLAGRSNELGFDLVRTYHPGYLRRSGRWKHDMSEALRLLKISLQPRA